MSLLKTLTIENAAAGATSAGAVAGGAFAPGNIIDVDAAKKRQKKHKGKMLRRVIEIAKPKKSFLESLGVDHGKNDFDAGDVLSKIDSAQKQERMNDDTTAFGLEDDEGNLVKVYVKTDQAEEFENTLASMLAGQQTDGDEENANAKEIAEIMYELKDKFDIVDVEWPGVETDEEEEQEVVDPSAAGMTPTGGAAPGGDAAGSGPEGAAGGEGDEDLGLEDPEGEEGLGDEEGDMEADDDAKSALQAVIDVMKADAEAKMADANAREAEARAKEAEYSAQGAAHKVKREEQVYDMEAAEKEDKTRKKEGEQQAKLARFQHSKAQDAEANLSFESVEDEDEDEDDDDDNDSNAITLTELTNLIFKHLRHQG